MDGTQITAVWLNHPQGCLGYRIDTTGGSIVYATDNEPGEHPNRPNLRNLAHGADVLIYDAQYSPEQLASDRKGWGHSSWLEGVKIAREAKVRNLGAVPSRSGFAGQGGGWFPFRCAPGISRDVGGDRGDVY